jgi:hypothetical protein
MQRKEAKVPPRLQPILLGFVNTVPIPILGETNGANGPSTADFQVGSRAGEYCPWPLWARLAACIPDAILRIGEGNIFVRSRLATRARLELPHGSSDHWRRPGRVSDSSPPRPSMESAPSPCRRTPWRSCASTAASYLRRAWRWVSESPMPTRCSSASWMGRLGDPIS